MINNLFKKYYNKHLQSTTMTTACQFCSSVCSDPNDKHARTSTHQIYDHSEDRLLSHNADPINIYHVTRMCKQHASIPFPLSAVVSNTEENVSCLSHIYIVLAHRGVATKLITPHNLNPHRESHDTNSHFKHTQTNKQTTHPKNVVMTDKAHVQFGVFF